MKRSPLHLAIDHKDRDIIKLLLQSGAHVNVKNLVNRIYRSVITFTASVNDDAYSQILSAIANTVVNQML